MNSVGNYNEKFSEEVYNSTVEQLPAGLGTKHERKDRR
jgi:hypothetical protein